MPELSNLMPTVAIIGDEFLLTSELRKNLLLKNIDVRDRLGRGGDTLKCIFLAGGFLTGKKTIKKSLVVETLEYARRSGTRVIIVLPYLLNNRDRKTLQTIIDLYYSSPDIDSYLIYVGEIYGEASYAKGDYKSLAINIFDEYKKKGSIGVAKGDFRFYPVSAKACVERLLRVSFTYEYGKRIFVVGSNITSYEFLNLIKEVHPATAFYQTNNKVTITTAGNIPIEDEKVTKESIEEMFVPIVAVNSKAETHPPVLKKSQVDVKELRKKNITRKYYLSISLFLITLFFSPFILIFVSLVTLKISYKTFLLGNFSVSSAGFRVSRATSAFAQMELSAIGSIKPIYSILSFPNEIAGIIEGVSNMGVRMVSTANNMESVLQGVLGGHDYDIKGLAQNISLDSDLAYQELSFLSANFPHFESLFSSNFSPDISLDIFRKYLLSLRNMSLEMPELLGSDSPKTYLVLFQNNSELRPTGGFIGSFGLLTFEKGRLTDRNMFDVYAADGQLKGHVEPPSAIRKYLGEANWYLRDSNWDPDFSASATKAEWFLDKEIGRSVDGVVGVDFEAIRNLLSLFGPIDIPEAGMVDAKNLYQKIQDEVEGDFFPGSQKKTNLLVSLSDSVIGKLTEVRPQSYEAIAKVLLSNLNSKHIQVFSHNSVVGDTLENASWDGGVIVPTCGINCQTIWFGTVEANLGVNKVNYYIERKSFFTSIYNKGFWENTLEVDLTNKASTSETLPKQYKAYIRALAPRGSLFSQVQVSDNGGTHNVTAEINEISGRVEAGVLAIIAPAKSGKVIFKWKQTANVNFVKNGGVGVFWRKQAGTLDDPVSIRIQIPRFANAFDKFTLTREGYFGYNTTLTGDLYPKIFW